MKQGYTMIIAAGTEFENCVENLWKRGPCGRRDYPDFGLYMLVKEFMCFKAAVPFCWPERKFWYVNRRYLSTVPVKRQ